MKRQSVCSDISELEGTARKIRRHVLNMIYEAGSGHLGGSLSCADILTALYFYTMRHRPSEPDWTERDRFILSKGHAAPALYAVLAEAGYFPVEQLWSLRKMGSMLQRHPDIRTLGVEISSGSLGQGLSVADGIALAGKLDRKDYRVYALLGDGECDEGQVWEAAMLASHYGLDNLTAIIDRNGLQIDGHTEKVMCLEPLAEKWKAFGWNVVEINGNNMTEIVTALDSAKKVCGMPTMIIAQTLKGKGVSFMEGTVASHARTLSREEMTIALQQL